MKKNIVRILSIFLPLAGILVSIWDSYIQSKAAEYDKQEFEQELVKKYNLQESDTE